MQIDQPRQSLRQRSHWLSFRSGIPQFLCPLPGCFRPFFLLFQPPFEKQRIRQLPPQIIGQGVRQFFQLVRRGFRSSARAFTRPVSAPDTPSVISVMPHTWLTVTP